MNKLLAFLSLVWIPSALMGASTPSSPPLSVEDKVGQLLMVHFHGDIANEEARILIQDIKVGGFIYYNWSNGLTSPSQVEELSSSLQKLAEQNPSHLPLLLATDQEGGVVARLTEGGFTVFPGNRALGETGDVTLAEESAFAIGQELQAVGVNMNLAPVADVNIQPRNPVIGVRSFGDDPETVGDFAEKALQGYQRAGIIASLKHFPGHGDTRTDSHEALPVVDKSLSELEKVELLPFARLAPQTDVIMTAHLLVPALDKDNCSTLSEKTLKYLREKLGFKGVIIADSLIMEGVLKRCKSVDEAAIAALKAGCDILLLGGKQLVGGHATELQLKDVQRIHSSVVEAVQKGEIPESRLDDAVARVTALKEKFLMAPRSQQRIDREAHQRLAGKIAALSLSSPKRSDIVLQDKRVLVVAPELIRGALQKTSLSSIASTTETNFFTLSPSQEEVTAALKASTDTDVVVVCSYNAWKIPAQEALIASLVATGKPVILLAVRDPLDAELFPKASAIFKTYSPTAPSIQAVFKELTHSVAETPKK